MSAKKENVETVKQIEYFSKALKAPRIGQATARLGDQAAESSRTHEEYLAAVLSREVSVREGALVSSGTWMSQLALLTARAELGHPPSVHKT